MSEHGWRFDLASRVAAELVNLYPPTDESRTVLYARIVYTLLAALYEAESTQMSNLYDPSVN